MDGGGWRREGGRGVGVGVTERHVRCVGVRQSGGEGEAKGCDGLDDVNRSLPSVFGFPCRCSGRHRYYRDRSTVTQARTHTHARAQSKKQKLLS